MLFAVVLFDLYLTACGIDISLHEILQTYEKIRQIRKERSKKRKKKRSSYNYTMCVRIDGSLQIFSFNYLII